MAAPRVRVWEGTLQPQETQGQAAVAAAETTSEAQATLSGTVANTMHTVGTAPMAARVL